MATRLGCARFLKGTLRGLAPDGLIAVAGNFLVRRRDDQLTIVLDEDEDVMDGVAARSGVEDHLPAYVTTFRIELHKGRNSPPCCR